MKIACAQLKNFLGDFKDSSKQIRDCIKKSAGGADLLIFPEGGLFSYPPKDFLYKQDLFDIQKKEVQKIQKNLPPKLAVLLPAFVKQSDGLYNGVYLLQKNKALKFFKKEFLPNTSVFYESRYFKKGSVKDNFFILNKKRVQILICEDFWHAKNLKNPDIIIALNASPYREKKHEERLSRAKALQKKYKSPIVYLNRVGGQDELIFDGRSFVMDKHGLKIWEADIFKADFKICDLDKSLDKKLLKSQMNNYSQEQEWEKALILGIKDFVSQLPFSKVIVGLSGGLDSALVLYLCAKALGNKNVTAYFLPSPFTEKVSYQITKEITKKLKIRLVTQDISKIHHQFLDFTFKNKKYKNLSSQNIQARIRATYLMAQSNETNALLIGTGNKSELAVGYSTLYGDLSGALLPIGDLWKTEVFQLAHFINKKESVFSKKLLTRAPSAELAKNQRDEKDLLPYKELDAILKKLLWFKSPRNLKEKKVAGLLYASEFKRWQAAPILKLKKISFGESRRMPIAHKFQI